MSNRFVNVVTKKMHGLKLSSDQVSPGSQNQSSGASPPTPSPAFCANKDVRHKGDSAPKTHFDIFGRKKKKSIAKPLATASEAPKVHQNELQNNPHKTPAALVTPTGSYMLQKTAISNSNARYNLDQNYSRPSAGFQLPGEKKSRVRLMKNVSDLSDSESSVEKYLSSESDQAVATSIVSSIESESISSSTNEVDSSSRPLFTTDLPSSPGEHGLENKSEVSIEAAEKSNASRDSSELHSSIQPLSNSTPPPKLVSQPQLSQEVVVPKPIATAKIAQKSPQHNESSNTTGVLKPSNLQNVPYNVSSSATRKQLPHPVTTVQTVIYPDGSRKVIKTTKTFQPDGRVSVTEEVTTFPPSKRVYHQQEV